MRNLSQNAASNFCEKSTSVGESVIEVLTTSGIGSGHFEFKNLQNLSGNVSSNFSEGSKFVGGLVSEILPSSGYSGGHFEF